MQRSIIYWLLLFIAIPGTTAEIYKWLDKDGKVHYSDKQPADFDAKTIDKQALTSKYSSYTQVAIKIAPYQALKYSQTNNLVMYTTSRCGYCAKARKYFAENNIRYKEKNIETSEKYQREFTNFGGTGVPVLFWGKYKMTGFSVARFKKMYAKNS
ncbi:NrdH-like redox domain-containing protein [Thalassotalea insulae]|uniref:NrdH-like redox domain-containing protein n=1 Tax=Thalassotalea insulae TaxID=2056778 RepID=A0ABQ6GR57_9GAMM|nr:glutaredoxin family protein [Thalassotalea insulae]GLX78435.1 NrdH-like redox domain-containing protein [Thalassotalea insulae]